MNKITCFVCTLLITACSNSQQKKEFNESCSIDSIKTDTVLLSNESEKEVELDSILCGLNFLPGKNYKTERSEIDKIRNELSQKYFNSSNAGEQKELLDSVAKTFTKVLLNDLIPYWYGTVWDFEGYTSVPNSGTIACGYFVSTTLRDMGLNLNRYKLAQQNPENEARSIAINLNEVIELTEDIITEELKSLENGVYFVGLDNHVGYLYINEDNAYFIHSNYIEGQVMIENMENSEAFYGENYYLSKITGNKDLMEKWLTGEEIQIVVE